MITKRLDLNSVVYAILHVSDILDYKEPVGGINAKSLRVLDACINLPFASYGGKYAYWYIEHKAAVLFYCIIKNHPLDNGNKRTAVVVTMYFLVTNKRWMKIMPDRLYDIACEVANSRASDKDKMINSLRVIFRKSMGWL